MRALATVTLVAVLAGGLAAAGNPVTRIKHGWDTFKGGYGADKSTGSRLVSGLGSNRYDFYRVALDEFLAHPLVGIGADNFQQQYLEHGRSDETPHYPHSVELRTLAETGLVGAILALVGLGGALWGAARAMRRSDPLAQSVAAAALAGFGYWVIHGSFDWFWEFAGLGAPAFALLGIACALEPSWRHDAKPAERDSGPHALPSTRASPNWYHLRPSAAEGVGSFLALACQPAGGWIGAGLRSGCRRRICWSLGASSEGDEDCRGAYSRTAAVGCPAAGPPGRRGFAGQGGQRRIAGSSERHGASGSTDGRGRDPVRPK